MRLVRISLAIVVSFVLMALICLPVQAEEGVVDLTAEVVTYQITDLSAGNLAENSIDLTWTTPAAEVYPFSYFDVRYSKATVTPDNWDEATRGTGEPAPVASASQGMKVRGLDSDTKYYFAIKVVDVAGLAGILSNIASETTLAAPLVDEIAPSQVTDLEANPGTPATTKVILSWTAPGDDGGSGTATSYEILRSSSRITDANWSSAAIIYNNIMPQAAGSSESFVISRLTPNTTYYFAIRARDEADKTSPTSNSPSISTATDLPIIKGISPTSGNNSQARTLTIDGANFVAGGTNIVRFVSDDNTFDLTSVTCSSSTQLTADVGKGAPTGTYRARVINDNNGTSKLSSATYEVTQALTPLPVVTNLIPQMAASDTAVSGVQIFGENLAGATAVSFGDTTASNVIKISDTKITADVPGLAAGEYDVKVTTPAGTNEVSAVKFMVSDPVVIKEGTTEDTTTSEVVKLDTNVVPVQLTLTTDKAETATKASDVDADIEVVIPPQTTVTCEGKAYTGNINPPRVVKPDETVLTGLPEDAVVIEMGNPEKTINFDKDFVATVTVTASAEPDIYYYNKDTGAYELAGKTGIKDGIHYIPGGTMLGLEDSVYTMGLLLDHMSVYIVSVKSLIAPSPAPPPPPPALGGGGGGFGPRLGTTDVRGRVSTEGRFYSAQTLFSFDKLCQLKIEKDTIGLTWELRPLTRISMLEMEEPPPPPEDAHIVGLAYDFQPSGATFEPPVTLECTYDPADIPEGVAKEDEAPFLVIAYWDEEAGEWVPLGVSIVNPATNTVTGLVSHFTPFAIIALPPPAPPPTLAAFSVSNLSIQPTQVQPKEAVTITVSVANTGGTEGSYSVVLKINGVKEAEKSVTVAAGESQEVSFTVTRKEARTYSVVVDGLSAFFTVVGPVLPTAPAPPALLPVPEVKPLVNWPLVGGIIAGVVVVAGLVIFLWVRRKVIWRKLGFS